MSTHSMLVLENTVLVIIDVQEKLVRAMYEKETLLNNMEKLIRGMQVLGIPIIVSEQNPERLGRTVPEVAELLPDLQPIPKLSFSCCGNERFLRELKDLNRKQVLLAGIETHICVYQTAMDLLDLGYEVQVITECVFSRTLANKNIGLSKMNSAGAVATSTEAVFFELLKVGEGERLKEIQKLVK
jgi:nicotinamidase-related amidase